MVRGGARAGAGRKPIGEGKARQIKVVLTPEQDRDIGLLAGKLGGERKKAEAIRRALTVGIGALKALGEIPAAEEPEAEKGPKEK
jgi:hypothetical protein